MKQNMKSALMCTSVMMMLSCKENSDLTRSNAADVISKNISSFAVMKVMLNLNAQDEGVREGVWDERGQLTASGQQTFANHQGNRITLMHPIQRQVLRITGIASAVSSVSMASSDLREVQFDWGYTNVSSLMKRLIGAGGNGNAILRKFDDGWRISEVHINEDQTPFELTASEKAEGDSLAAKVTKEAATADLGAEGDGPVNVNDPPDVRAAKIPSNQLAHYVSIDPKSGNSNPTPLLLTDVGVWDATGGFLFYEIQGKTPQKSEIRMGAMVGYTVYFDGMKNFPVFYNPETRDEFFNLLQQALSAWRAKYPKYR